MNKVLEEILKLADSQVGYKETGTNHTKYSQYFDNSDGAWQWFNTKKQGSEWCSIFICWLFTQVIGNKPALSFLGCPAPKYNCAAGCGYLYDYMKAKGYKSDISHVKPGDIVFFKNGSKCSHVGIAESVSAGKVITIEGNKDNAVKRVSHNISSNIYFGVMSPDYASAHWVGEKEDVKPADPAHKPEPASPVQTVYTVNTNKDPLRLRTQPNTSCPTICLMPKGSKVTLIQIVNSEWMKVKYRTMIGYAYRKYLK